METQLAKVHFLQDRKAVSKRFSKGFAKVFKRFLKGFYKVFERISSGVSMVSKWFLKDLGFQKNMAEAGIYHTVIGANHLHGMTKNGHGFTKPQKMSNSFFALYKQLDRWFEDSRGEFIRLDEILKKMGDRPFGVKKGIRPLIAFMYYLT